MSKANERQVGGSHYQSSMQHWDFVEDNGVGYLEGCATKYVTRWRKKNGLQDLEKGCHYIEKLIELAKDGRESRSRGSVLVPAFCIANDLTSAESRVCQILFGDWSISELHEALGIVQGLIAENTIVRSDNTGMEHPFGYTEEE